VVTRAVSIQPKSWRWLSRNPVMLIATIITQTNTLTTLR